MKYQNRIDAGHQIAYALMKYKDEPDAILLAIPRGALELGAVLRDELKIPLDIVVTKKIGAPGNEEYAIGSVGPDGKYDYNKDVIDHYNVPLAYIEDEAKRLKHVIKRRYEEYRGDRDLPELKAKKVIIIDDGIATGFTTKAAIRYVKRQQPKKVILAVPVSAKESYEQLKEEVDELISLQVREDFYAVGQFYEEFNQVSDEEAKKLLNRAK